MLRNKTNYSGRAQNQENGNTSRRPLSNNNRLFCKLVFVPQLFPVASNYVGGNSTVAASQISWSHQPVSNKAAFRKMLCLALVGKKACVSRWGWSSPGAHNSTVSFQSQRVFGIYATYRAPVQSGESKDVVYNDFRFGHLDTWIPKQQPGKKAKPNVNPYFGEQNRYRFGGKRNDSYGRKSYSQNRHDFARARSKQLGIHSVSFTQSAREVGAAL